MSRKTKAQRRKLIPADLMERISLLDDNTLLAVHDLIHELMEKRHGSSKRFAASQPAPLSGCGVG